MKMLLSYQDHWRNQSHVNHFLLLTKKGVFPYEYLYTWCKLPEPPLPLIEPSLTREASSGFASVDVEKTWQWPYTKTDILLLADVFENFLDPAHYFVFNILISLSSSWKSNCCLVKLLTFQVEFIGLLSLSSRNNIMTVFRVTRELLVKGNRLNRVDPPVRYKVSACFPSRTCTGFVARLHH